MSSAQAVLEFWKSIGPKGWWMKDDAVDQKIIADFSDLHGQADAGGLAEWEDDPDECLAKVILLDQFSRNMFRNDPRTFASDLIALKIARAAIEKGFDQKCDPELKNFYYLPFMHSESLSDQQFCVRKMYSDGEPNSLAAAVEHRAIIERFGRFPHRNPVLGRATTPAEAAFLDGGGFRG